MELISKRREYQIIEADRKIGGENVKQKLLSYVEGQKPFLRNVM